MANLKLLTWGKGNAWRTGLGGTDWGMVNQCLVQNGEEMSLLLVLSAVRMETNPVQMTEEQMCQQLTQ